MEINNKLLKNTKYSTTETICGTWKDGKPIYRKVFTGSTGSTLNTWKKIINLSYDTIIHKEGWWTSGSDYYDFERSYNNEEITLYWKSDGLYEMHNYSYANNRAFEFVIEYTKTTD